VVDRAPVAVAAEPPAKIFNIGNHSPVPLMDFIATLERCLGRQASLCMLPMQPSDMPATYADIEALAQWVQFRPSTSIETGLARFTEWFRAYYAR